MLVKKCLFYFGRRIRDSPSPPPALPVYPAGGDPSPQRTRNDGTRQAAGQTMPKPGRANTRADRPPKSWTRCTGLHSMPDRPRGIDRTGGERWRVGSASETVQIWTRHSSTHAQTLKSVQCCVCNLTRTLKSAIIMPETNKH